MPPTTVTPRSRASLVQPAAVGPSAGSASARASDSLRKTYPLADNSGSTIMDAPSAAAAAAAARPVRRLASFSPTCSAIWQHAIRDFTITPALLRGRPGTAGSQLHLPAPFVHWAARRDRADPTPGVGGRGEDRAGHSGRDGLDQLGGPAGIGVVAERTLGLHPGTSRQASLAHLDELGPARLRQAELLERTQLYGQLIYPKLRMPVQFCVGRPARSGLQVDHDRGTVLAALQPVDLAGDGDLAHPDA